MTVTVDAVRLARLIDQQDIRDVVYRYCRGIDRCDFDLVRSCYHVDGTDDHGDFRGGVDEFIAYVQGALSRYERTMHFIGNVLVEPDGDRARSESYVVAYHRVSASDTKPKRDFVVGLRYVDTFEQRLGQWRIAARVCAVDWSRTDPVTPGGWVPGSTTTVGQRDKTDAVYSPVGALTDGRGMIAGHGE